MKEPKLTTKDYRYIFSIAHKEWLAMAKPKGERPEELLLTKAYVKAVVSYLQSIGYEVTRDEE